MEGMGAGQIEDIGETIMNEMINEVESLGQKEDYNGVVDNMMRQLLSKDVRARCIPFVGVTVADMTWL